MSRLKIYVCLALSLLAFSCNRELEYSVSTPDAALVVNCVFAHDSLWRVEVSTTADPGNGGKIKSLKDAKVAIFENNVKVSDIVLDSVEAKATFSAEETGRAGYVQLFFHRSVASRASAGRNYEIRVSHPDYPTVYSANVIPRAPRLRKVNTTGTVASQIIEGKSHVKIPFELVDDPGQNYYGIEVWVRQNDTDLDFKKVSFYSPDQALLENTLVNESNAVGQHLFPAVSTVFLSNTSFQGQSKVFNLFVDNDVYMNAKDVRVRVLRLSEDLYKFVTSFQRQLINQSNPFAEPVQVYSNIQNGSGIFAGYSTAELNPR